MKYKELFEYKKRLLQVLVMKGTYEINDQKPYKMFQTYS